MTLEEILAHPPRVLSEAQRARYFEQGYLHLERFIPEEWVQRLRAATAEMVERARSVPASDDEYVVEPDHCRAAPRLRRLNCAADRHPTYWSFAFQSPVPDLVADLVGPDVKFRESMLNFKASSGGDQVRWHQDIPFYPHTNTTPLITLTCIEDVTEEMGPLQVIPGSHKLGFFDHYDEHGQWAGRVSDEDLKTVPVGDAMSLTGPAGSITVIHGGMIHGSQPNHSDRWRPLLVCGYSSADAFCYSRIGTNSKYIWRMARGEPAKYAHHEPLRLRVPPDWSGAYRSIFEDQKGERRSA